MIHVMLSTLLHSFIRIMLSLLRTFGLGRFAPVFIVIWNKAFTSHNYLNIRSIVPKLPVPQYWQQPGGSLIMSGRWCDVRYVHHCIRRNWILFPPGLSPQDTTPDLGQSDQQSECCEAESSAGGSSAGGCFNFPTNSRRKVAPGFITI